MLSRSQFLSISAVIGASFLAGLQPTWAAIVSFKATAVNGEPISGGPTGTLGAEPGDTITVDIFLSDWQPHWLRAYQVQVDAASFISDETGSLLPQAGASQIDATRPDFAFAGFSVQPEDMQAFAVTDISSSDFRWAGGLFEALFIVPDTGAEVYLGTLEVRASSDASGMFTIGPDIGRTFILDNDTPPQVIGPLFIEPLELIAGNPCINLRDCGDVDDNGVRDDVCLSYACNAGECSTQVRATQADIGGGNGSCVIDGTCDGNDRFHALNCFSNTSTMSIGSYPCAANPPSAINVDAGGPAISCVLDGVCDGNDAFHALNCFSNIGSMGNPPYPCGCAGPSPAVADGPTLPRQATGITLRGPRSARPGEVIDVDVHLDDALGALRGYQLHLGVRGGSQVALELVDLGVDTERSDWAFANAVGVWQGFNRATAQLLLGVDAAEGVAVAAGNYLATVTYRVPRTAAGTFVVDVLYDGSSPSPSERTFLFGENARPINVSSVTQALITVEDPTQKARVGKRDPGR